MTREEFCANSVLCRALIMMVVNQVVERGEATLDDLRDGGGFSADVFPSENPDIICVALNGRRPGLAGVPFETILPLIPKWTKAGKSVFGVH